MDGMTVAVIGLTLYGLLGTIYFCVGSYRNEVRLRKNAEQNLAVADECVQDLETEKEELASGYAIMATTIESLQSELEDIHKWAEGQDAHMEKHCEQINSILDILQKPLAVQFVRVQQPTNDYTGPDEDTDEDPYPAVVPEYIQTAINTIEGLDEL